MASRFGRNKRRDARKRISDLEAEAAWLSRQLAASQRLIATAKEDGATAVLRTRYLDMAVKDITRHLAHAYGPELMKAAQRVLDADRTRSRPLIDFRAVMDIPVEPIETVTIEGFIPSLHFRVQLAHF